MNLIKLHPDDYYVFGLERGGVDERWFASTTWAENGPDTPIDEGLSYVVSNDGKTQILLRDMVDEFKGLPPQRERAGQRRYRPWSAA